MQDLENTQYFKVEVEPENGVKMISHNNARSLIMKVERDELVEEMLKEYIEKNHWKR